jgi:hypothetical protein
MVSIYGLMFDPAGIQQQLSIVQNILPAEAYQLLQRPAEPARIQFRRRTRLRVHHRTASIDLEYVKRNEGVDNRVEHRL